LALKIFPYENYAISEAFETEARFSWLSHENVIKVLHVSEKQKVLQGNNYKEVSYVLMELAPYGDLSEFIRSEVYPSD